MAPRKPHHDPDSDTEPRFKPPIDWNKITVPIGFMSVVVTCTWVLAAKLNTIENRLMSIEGRQLQNWTVADQKEYYFTMKYKNPSLNMDDSHPDSIRSRNRP